MSISRETVVRGLTTNRASLAAYIWSMVHDHHAVEDISQDVMILAIEKCEAIKDADHLLAWARVVARHKAIDHLRKQSRQPQQLSEEVLSMLESHWESSAQLEVASRDDALRACLNELAPRSREILRLRYERGLSGEEAAKSLGLKRHSVYVALGRAYRALENCIERRLNKENEA